MKIEERLNQLERGIEIIRLKKAWITDSFLKISTEINTIMTDLNKLSYIAKQMVEQINGIKDEVNGEGTDEPQKTSDLTCNDCGHFICVSEEGVGYCRKTGDALLKTTIACKNWEQKQ